MNLRLKIILIFICTSLLPLLLLGIILFTYYTVFSQQILALDLKQNSSDLKNYLHQQESNFLNKNVQDYATWDEMYQAVTANDQKWFDVNLKNWGYNQFELNFISVVNNQGASEYQYGLPFDQIYSFNLQQIRNLTLKQTKILAYYNTSDGLMRIGAAPIVHSDTTGPANGVLIFGQLLDRDYLVKLANIFNYPLAIKSADSLTSNQSTAFSAGSGYTQESLELTNLQGNRIGQIIIADNTARYQPIINALLKNFILALFIDILLILFLGLFLERSISRPIEKILKSTNSLVGGLPSKVSINTKDIIGKLGENFNRMVDRLKETSEDNLIKRKDIENHNAAVLNMLEDINQQKEQVSQANQKLEELNQNLDQKVRQSTADLRKAYDDLKSLDSLKDEFLNISAHELKTPLTSIIGLSELIIMKKQGKITALQEKSLTIVNNEANRLLNIIKKILGITRIEAKKAIFNLEPVDMCAIVPKVIEGLKHIAEQSKVTIVCNPPQKEVMVLADPERTQEVVYNFIDNALKFSPPLGHVTVSGEVTAQEFIFSVKDQGPGIAPEKKDKLFQKFSQLDTGFARKQEGTGLGLYISKIIIENMKGKIWVESKPGQGADFKFSLPLAKTK